MESPITKTLGIAPHDHNEPRIDLTKSLHHLRRHGFDFSKMTQTINMLSPETHICQTPPVSPRKGRPLLQESHMNGGSTFFPSMKPHAGIDRSASTESNSSFSSSGKEEPDFTDDASSISAEFEDEEQSSCSHLPFSPLLMRSTINDDEGDTVEVTLDHCNGAAYDVSDLEQLVEECDYPPLTPQTPMRVTFCGLPHCFDTKTFSMGEGGNLLRGNMCPLPDGLCESLFQDVAAKETIQSEVCALLGGEGWCWQALYSTSKSPYMYPISEFEEPIDECNSMKKRLTFNLAARRSRLDMIRRELNPFSDTQFIPDHRYPINRSQSFSQTSAPIFADKQNSTQLNAMWECGSLDDTVPHEPPLSKSSHPDEGYDSDPEDYYNKENHPNALGMSSETVEEFLNERCTLIQHDEKSVAVHIWIERGHQLRDSIILPKLFWKPIHGNERSSLDLIDICRILVVDFVDREKHPFADLQRLISIKSISQKPLMFEARSLEERDRWIMLLKQTVSTLAAKFLTNDPSALSLFFVDNGVLPTGRVSSQKSPTQKLEAWV